MSSRNVLTIDADWALSPTPLQLALGGDERPRQTLEADVYDFTSERRPWDGRHQIANPTQVAQQLFACGLSQKAARQAVLTSEHQHILKSIGGRQVEHIVCVDAHLDIYAVLSVELDREHPGQIRDLTVMSVFAGTVLQDLQMPLAEAKRRLGSRPVGTLESMIRMGAWLLWVSRFNTRNDLRVDWVVPTHFLAALDQGFPYPDAQWHQTLKVGVARRIWAYGLSAENRSIQLNPIWNSALTIRLVSLEEVDLKDTGLVHICRSPGHTPPEMDSWADRLVRELTR